MVRMADTVEPNQTPGGGVSADAAAAAPAVDAQGEVTTAAAAAVEVSASPVNTPTTLGPSAPPGITAPMAVDGSQSEVQALRQLVAELRARMEVMAKSQGSKAEEEQEPEPHAKRT